MDFNSDSSKGANSKYLPPQSNSSHNELSLAASHPELTSKPSKFVPDIRPSPLTDDPPCDVPTGALGEPLDKGSSESH